MSDSKLPPRKDGDDLVFVTSKSGGGLDERADDADNEGDIGGELWTRGEWQDTELEGEDIEDIEDVGDDKNALVSSFEWLSSSRSFFIELDLSELFLSNTSDRILVRRQAANNKWINHWHKQLQSSMLTCVTLAEIFA